MDGKTLLQQNPPVRVLNDVVPAVAGCPYNDRKMMIVLILVESHITVCTVCSLRNCVVPHTLEL